MRQLTKCYSGYRVVNGLNLSIPRGSVYGLLGRNGAGKSTTIKMLTGMVHPDFGQIELLGEDISRMAPERRERIAYIAENHPLYRWMTVKGAIRFARSFYRHWNQTLVDQILDHFEISGRRWIGRMSNGQHAQVSLASALAPDPDLLILDEPTLGLDTVFRRDFLESMIQIIDRTGRTILMTSHILNDVDRVADRIGIMVNGVLRVDCPTEHFKDSIRRVIDDFHETLAANDGMRLVNLEQRTCSLISSLPQGFQGIHGGRRSGIDEPAKQRGRRFDQLDWYVIIRKVDSLIRMNLDGSDVVRMELPQDVRSYQIYYCETYDGSSYLHASLNVQVFGKTSVSGAIFDVNSSGELSNRRDYAWVNPSGALSETADSFSLGMAMPAPMLTGGVAVFSAATGAPWSPTQNTLRFLPAIVSGLIAVWVSRRFQSKQPHSHQTFWLVFVACLGVFGYIGYRYHRRWPLAEFREMKVDTFSAPAANGLEVFA